MSAYYEAKIYRPPLNIIFLLYKQKKKKTNKQTNKQRTNKQTVKFWYLELLDRYFLISPFFYKMFYDVIVV